MTPYASYIQNITLATSSRRARTSPAELADIVRRIHERLTGIPEEEGVWIMTGAYILAGMRYRDEDGLDRIFQEYGMMKQSSVWDQKLYEGELRGIRKSIRSLCERKFGPPTPEHESALALMEDGDRLQRILNEILSARRWDELVATP